MSYTQQLTKKQIRDKLYYLKKTNQIEKYKKALKKYRDITDDEEEQPKEESNKTTHHTVGLIHIDEPIIDEIIKTNGKAYYDWIVASNTLASLIEYKAKYKQMNKGGKSKKSRKNRK